MFQQGNLDLIELSYDEAINVKNIISILKKITH